MSRVWAPFGPQNATAPDTGHRGGKQKAWYCHGYQQVGEHYHASYEDLLDCDLLGDEPHLRPARAVRAREQAMRRERTSKQ